MSEGMFRGRAFTIPYDTTTDQHVASMARAQITTRVSSPGAIVQVGDQVLPVGVTAQQVHMGDLDIRLRSFQQLSNEAQNAVRNNIQWQYGEQVGGDVQKGWLSELLGISHWSGSRQNKASVNPNKGLPMPSLYQDEAPVAAKTPVMTQPPAPGASPAAAPAPAPAPAAASTRSTPKPKAPAAPPAPAAPAAPPTPKMPGRRTGPKAAPAAASPVAAPATTASVGPRTGGMKPGLFTEFKTAAGRMAARHDALRESEGWSVDRSLKGGVYTSVATKDGASETHTIEYDPATNGFRHTFAEDGAPPVVTPLDSVDALHDHVNGSHKSWDS